MTAPHDWSAEELERLQFAHEVCAFAVCVLMDIGLMAVGIWALVLGHTAGWLALAGAALFAVFALYIAEPWEVDDGRR